MDKGSVRSTAANINCGEPGGRQCSATLADGSGVTLTAVPKTSTEEFVSWGGACAGTTPTCALTLNADKTVTATFRRKP